METIGAIIFGILIGMLIMHLLTVRIVDGDLYINMSDPDYAACGVDFRKGANVLSRQKVAILKIHTRK